MIAVFCTLVIPMISEISHVQERNKIAYSFTRSNIKTVLLVLEVLWLNFITKYFLLNPWNLCVLLFWGQGYYSCFHKKYLLIFLLRNFWWNEFPLNNSTFCWFRRIFSFCRGILDEIFNKWSPTISLVLFWCSIDVTITVVVSKKM